MDYSFSFITLYWFCGLCCKRFPRTIVWISLHLVEQYDIAAYLNMTASFSEQENILLSQRGPGNIKVVDFGSSCYEQQRGKKKRLHVIAGFFLFFQNKCSPENLYNSRLPLSLSISVHIHSESILPLSRGYTGSPLQHGHWHVESGLHPCWTLHRLSSLPRRKWGGTDSLYNGGMT